MVVYNEPHAYARPTDFTPALKRQLERHYSELKSRLGKLDPEDMKSKVAGLDLFDEIDMNDLWPQLALGLLAECNALNRQLGRERINQDSGSGSYPPRYPW